MDDLSHFADYLEAPAGPVRALDVPAEMVLQIATGLEDPADIARRFGFEEDDWRALASWQPFRDQVVAKRMELQKSGVTFRIQCAYMAEDLGKDVYRIAKMNDATLPQKLEAFRTMAKLADLEPKQTQQVNQAGPGFSISINFGAPPPRGVTIDQQPTQIGGSA